jgi:hypothetical protein
MNFDPLCNQRVIRVAFHPKSALMYGKKLGQAAIQIILKKPLYC